MATTADPGMPLLRLLAAASILAFSAVSAASTGGSVSSSSASFSSNSRWFGPPGSASRSAAGSAVSLLSAPPISAVSSTAGSSASGPATWARRSPTTRRSAPSSQAAADPETSSSSSVGCVLDGNLLLSSTDSTTTPPPTAEGLMVESADNLVTEPAARPCKARPATRRPAAAQPAVRRPLSALSLAGLLVTLLAEAAPRALRGLARGFSPSQVVALAEDAAESFARSRRVFRVSAAEAVRFDLFTRQQPTTPTRIFAQRNESVERSTFDPAKPTKMIIHGFFSHQGPGTGGDALKNAFLAAQDCNVVTVDWSGADPHEYGAAVRRALPRVAAECAALIRALQARGASLDDVHVLGHSLGGQIAGAVGSLVLGPAHAGRVTGLDPARPFFEGRGPSHRLDPSDAGFVDVIHTDGGHLGYAGPAGHADFYPQGGMHVQPGCGRDATGLCSHCVAYEYMIEALLQPGASVFRSCTSWEAYLDGECEAGGNAVMGIYTDSRSRGSFFLSSNKTVREDLRNASQKDILWLLSAMRTPRGGRDTVMIAQC